MNTVSSLRPRSTSSAALLARGVAAWLQGARRVRDALNHLPVELRVLLPFLAVFLVGLLVGLPLNLPDAEGLHFAEAHYFRPLVAALAAQLFVLALRRRLGAHCVEPALVPACAVLVLGATWLHFNFKAWMPFVNGQLFDEALARTDFALDPWVPSSVRLRRSVAGLVSHTGYDIDRLYHDGFVAMFFAAFTLHALLDRPRVLRRVVLASSLVLLLGGLSYWLLPAKGPFVFRHPESLMANETQQQMSALFEQVVQQGRLPPGYFVAPLAAMPSLHLAHALLFTVFAARHQKFMLLFYLPLLAWITIEAVASAWHYALDLPAGALLCWLCLRLSDRLLPEPRP